MPEPFTVQKMVDQAIENVEKIDFYLERIAVGFQISMIGKTPEQSTEEWRAQLVGLRQLDAAMIQAIKADPRNRVRIESRLHPEFGNT